MWVKRTEYNYDRYDYRTATMSLPLLDVLSFRTVEGDLRRLSEPGDRHYLGVAGRAYGGCMRATMYICPTWMPKRMIPMPAANLRGA